MTMYAYAEPPLPPSSNATPAEAADYVRGLVTFIGAGFHPDTPFEDYTMPDGSQCFDAPSIHRLELGLSRAWTILDAAHADLYEIAYPVQRELFLTS